MWFDFDNVLINKDKITHIVFGRDERNMPTAYIFLQNLNVPLEFQSEDEMALRSTFKDWLIGSSQIIPREPKND